MGQKLSALWADAKRHPVVSVVVAVVIGFAAYYFYNRAKTTNGTTTPTTHASPGGYTIVNEYYQAAPQGTKPPHPVPHKHPCPDGKEPDANGKCVGNDPHQDCYAKCESLSGGAADTCKQQCGGGIVGNLPYSNRGGQGPTGGP